MAFNTDGGTLALAVPFTKATDAGDGTVYVEGLCTDDNLDLDDQIIDAEFAAKGLDAWFKDWGNVRQMHSGNLPPAGKAISMEKRAEGIWVRAHIVEPTAVKLVKEEVYKAFSVGISRPRIISDFTAKGGRVVDGVFSEISLVDFPANPRAKFQLAKRAGSGDIEIVEKAVEVEMAKSIPTPAEVFGTLTKSDKEHVPTETTATEAELAKAGAKNCSNCGEQHDSDSKAKYCGNCGTKLGKAAEADLTKHCGVPGCTQDGDHDHAANKAAAKPDTDTDTDGDGDGDDDASASKVEMPYYVKRLHDATCAAFQEADVLGIHPAVAKGIPSLVDPMHWGSQVTKAVAESDIQNVVSLSEGFGIALQLQKSDPALCDEAMEDLRKAFAEYNPTAHPSPTSAITPGQFKRPYASAGRAPLSPSGTPRIPLTSHAASPGDFQGGYVSDGRAAESPQNGKAAEADLTKRTYYTNAAKEEASTVMRQMHDYIVAQHPYACPMDHDMVPTALPAEKTFDNRATSSPTPVTPPAPMNVEKGSELHKAFVGIATETANDLIQKALKPLEEENAALKKKVAEIAAAPDPASTAYRGAGLSGLRPQAQEATAGRGEGEEAARKLAVLVKNARHPNSDVSRPAYDQLTKLVGPDQAADLVIG